MKMLSAHRSGPHQKSGREIGRNNGGSGLRNSIPIKHLSCYWRFDSPTNSTDEAYLQTGLIPKLDVADLLPPRLSGTLILADDSCSEIPLPPVMAPEPRVNLLIPRVLYFISWDRSR